MSRKNDDSVEKFFRKAVRQSDTTFRESDWLAMEKMLDDQAQLRAAARLKFWRRMATGFSGVLLLSVGLYLLIPGEELQSNAVVSFEPIAGNETSTVDGPRSTENAVVSAEPTAGNEKSTVDGPQSTENTGNAVVSAEPTAGNEKSTVDGPQSTENAGNAVVSSGPTAGNEKSTVNSRRSTENAGNAVVSSGATAGNKRTTAGTRLTENAGRQSTAGNTKPTGDSPRSADKNAKLTIGNAGQKGSQGVPRDGGGTEQVDATVAEATTASNKHDKNIKAKPAAPAPTVAGVLEQPDHTSKLDGAEQHNTVATPSDASKASAASTSGGQSSSVVATEDNGSARDHGTTPDDATSIPLLSERSTLPAVTAASDIPTQQQKQPLAVDQRSSSGNRQSTVDSLRSSNHEQPAVTPVRTVDSISAFSVDRRLSTVDPAPPVDSTLTAPAAHTEHADSTSQQPPRIPTRWSAALVFAPDFSSTGIGSEMTAPGQAFGGMIGYRVSKRFTITSGVLKSSKKYVGYGSDYTPPEGYWLRRTNGVVPNEIVGRCTIIEVPLLVQFDLRQGKRSRLYLSGGVSSYFMRHESYDYNFDEPNDGADRGWSSSEPSSFLFKVGHLSAAYELMVMPSLGVGIEPFIKIPFQGIGWANISLYTTGAYVNVRYYLLKKNK